MKVLICLVVCACAVASAREALPSPLETTAFDYHRRFGIPLADSIRKQEEEAARNPGRIVGGAPSVLGQHPHKCGLVADLENMDGARGVCGGSLVSDTRVLTAAHCWFDGSTQAWRFTVTLGSTRLFAVDEVGVQVLSSAVVVHNGWLSTWPGTLADDIAMIIIDRVILSSFIQPVALPDNFLDEDFTGSIATAAGYGLTGDDAAIGPNQGLNHVSLIVISNFRCTLSFPLLIRNTHICTSGEGGVGPCGGDSGGSLTTVRGGVHVLIGVTSFGSPSCEGDNPAGYTRVTSYTEWIRRLL